MASREALIPGKEYRMGYNQIRDSLGMTIIGVQ